MSLPRSFSVALVLVALPVATEAQIGVRVGAHGAIRSSTQSIDHSRIGGRLTLVPYERFSFSLLVDRVLKDRDDNAATTLSGWHATGRMQLMPFAKILYLGWGVTFVHERWEVEGTFSETSQLDERWQGMSFAGLEYPFGRLHPFFEVQLGNLTGGGATQWNYVFGVDVRIK